jgi:hypothetical protein
MSNQPHFNSSTNVTTPSEPLSELRFLLGDWQAISKPGEPTGGFIFAYQLQSKIIVRTNYADYPATKERPAFRHEDLMIIYRDESRAIRADFYDSEGHVIRYIGKTSDAKRVEFVSEPLPSSPRFCLSYRLNDKGEIFGAFEIAPSNRPEEFTPYLTWSAIKKPQMGS